MKFGVAGEEHTQKRCTGTADHVEEVAFIPPDTP